MTRYIILGVPRGEVLAWSWLVMDEHGEMIPDSPRKHHRGAALARDTNMDALIEAAQAQHPDHHILPVAVDVDRHVWRRRAVIV
jgi:hypothetical protein